MSEYSYTTVRRAVAAAKMVWVVFDGTEPDSAVIGVAADLEAAVAVIDQTVDRTEPISITVIHSDVAKFASQGGGQRQVWRAEKHSVLAS